MRSQTNKLEFWRYFFRMASNQRVGSSNLSGRAIYLLRGEQVAAFLQFLFFLRFTHNTHNCRNFESSSDLFHDLFSEFFVPIELERHPFVAGAYKYDAVQPRRG